MTSEQSPEGPREGGCKSIKQRFRVITELPEHLTFCPTLRHEEQIKIRRRRNRNHITHCSRCHLAGPGTHQCIWLLCLHSRQDTHFTQGSPELSKWSLLPQIPEAPASGCGSSTPHRAPSIPLGCPKTGASRVPRARFRSSSRPSPRPGRRVGKEDLGSHCLNQEGRQSC